MKNRSFFEKRRIDLRNKNDEKIMIKMKKLKLIDN